MKNFAFVSRHQPTVGQLLIAAMGDINLVPVGDRDAFSIDPAEFAQYEGVVVVHPAAALRLMAAGKYVGVFENESRAAEGQKPTFEAARLHVFAEVGSHDPGFELIQHRFDASGRI